MTTYIIGMQFIAWMMAIMMVAGILLIKAIEYDLSNPDSKSDDMIKMGGEKIIDEYNERNLFGRFAFVIFWGARILALPFRLKERD